jgi:2-succinyl-6-hydroxy-2,4-cyclohexadiene-1-carboxylate synthase
MWINGIEYHYVLHGKGEPLLLLHGFTGSSQNWSPVMATFADKYAVIAPDLIGHGQTASPPNPDRYTIQHVCDDIATLIQTLTPQPVHLLGYSMGGRVALALAIAYPHLVKTLTLESASPGLENEAERAMRQTSDDTLATRIEQVGIEAFVDEWERLSLWHTQTPEQKNALRVQRLRNHPTGLANSLRGYGTGVQPSLWAKLSQVHMPTLLIVGEYDKKFVQIAEQMHTRLSHSHKHTIPQAGHTTHLENSAIFVRVVLEFLANHE